MSIREPGRPCILCGRPTVRLLNSSCGVHVKCEEQQDMKVTR